MINVAIIGAGAISRSHIRAYQAFPDRCRIVAVVDIKIERAKERIASFGLDAVALDNHEAVLAGYDIDLASVCTPPSSHAEISCHLLDAGINTLCEKPMAPSLAECDAVLAAAERSGKVLSVVAQRRFQNSWMNLKKLLDSGITGPITHAQVDSCWWRAPNYYDVEWRGRWETEGGGPTLNHAVHHIDAMQWMAGRPVEVNAVMANVAHETSEVEDVSVAVVKFGSGALGQITSSVIHYGQQQQIAFQTERAMIATPWEVHASTARSNGFPDPDEKTEREITEYYESLPVTSFEGHAGQVDDVLKAVEAADPSKVLIDGHEGRATLEIITGIYKSAMLRQPVSLPLAADDPFQAQAGLLAAAPRFHHKQAGTGTDSVIVDDRIDLDPEPGSSNAH